MLPPLRPHHHHHPTTLTEPPHTNPKPSPYVRLTLRDSFRVPSQSCPARLATLATLTTLTQTSSLLRFVARPFKCLSSPLRATFVLEGPRRSQCARHRPRRRGVWEGVSVRVVEVGRVLEHLKFHHLYEGELSIHWDSAGGDAGARWDPIHGFGSSTKGVRGASSRSVAPPTCLLWRTSRRPLRTSATLRGGICRRPS